MYQRILIPIDGSETSERAVQEAIKLANGATQFKIVYVLQEIYPLDAAGYEYIDFTALLEAAKLTGERALQQASDKIKQAGATAETVLIPAGNERIASVIESAANSWHADLIVIGSHGRSGLNRLLVGSVAEGVVRLASVPVLLVRAE